jgi:p-aminobenzoyl-glutamate transporter AbgT
MSTPFTEKLDRTWHGTIKKSKEVVNLIEAKINKLAKYLVIVADIY